MRNHVDESALDFHTKSVWEHESAELAQATDPLLRVAVKPVGAGGTPATADVAVVLSEGRAVGELPPEPHAASIKAAAANPAIHVRVCFTPHNLMLTNHT